MSHHQLISPDYLCKDISMCLASCNRFDLLQKTLTSFFKFNTYPIPIKKLIIGEDSVKETMKNNILNYFSNANGQFFVPKIRPREVELIYNEINIGPFKNFDNLYNQIDTDYLFHCEDDWEFQNNSNFMQESVDILEERKDIHQVWLRDMTEFDSSVYYNEILTTSNGTKYRIIKYHGPDNDWCGFSGNPGLRRLSDYKMIFPNGYAEFIDKTRNMVFTELFCSINAKKHNWKAAALMNYTVKHLGGGRSTLK